MAKQYKAFVSSTYEDLKRHRALVIKALREAGIHVDPMEDWTADSHEPKELCVKRLEGCHLCVLLVAFRRGYVPHGATDSITQLEYDHARQRGMDVLAFLLREDEPSWPDGFDERKDDPAICEWRDKLKADHVVSFFRRRPESVKIPPAISRWLLKGPSLGTQKRAYLESVAAACEWIDLGGLAPRVGTELLRLPIDDVFVHLHAERDVPLADEQVREEFRLKHELERDGAATEKIEEEIEKLAERFGRGAKRGETPTRERVEIQGALEHSRIVVLGDPARERRRCSATSCAMSPRTATNQRSPSVRECCPSTCALDSTISIVSGRGQPA